MKSTDDIRPNLPHKALALLGRDEMNLAEFPIALLTDRVPKNQQEAIYQDEIHDERSGLTLTRKLTITAGNHGLTTALDDEVILSLIQLTKKKNNFTQRRLEFSRYELVQLLRWSMGGASYERIATALDRWTSVYLKYENAWRDNRTKSWKSAGFHILDRFELNDFRADDAQLDLMPSFIVWNEVIFESFQAGYLKPLDYDLCMGLSNSTAKRMYRFLDKRFHHRADWTFPLKEFACEHIGLGRNYDGPAHLKRKLQPAISELESIGFLTRLPDSKRFPKDGKGWKIRLILNSAGVVESTSDPRQETPEADRPALVIELTKRGVTGKTAAELVGKHPAAKIEAKIDVFDWLLEKQDKRVARSPEGYLVKSIIDDYKAPKGFVSAAERQQQKEAKQARERKVAEDRRKECEEKAREKTERGAIEAYWASLSPEQQEALDSAARAQADPATLAMETGAFRSLARTLRRQEFIRNILATRDRPPVA